MPEEKKKKNSNQQKENPTFKGLYTHWTRKHSNKSMQASCTYILEEPQESYINPIIKEKKKKYKS